MRRTISIKIVIITMTRKLPEKEHDTIHLSEYKGNGQVVLIVDDVLEKTIADRDDRCEVTVYLQECPESSTANGREYFRSPGDVD